MEKSRKIKLIFIIIFTIFAIISYVISETCEGFLFFYFAGIIIALLLPGVLFIYFIPHAFPFFTGTSDSSSSILPIIILSYLINIAIVFFIGFIVRSKNKGESKKVMISLGLVVVLIVVILLGRFLIESSENVDTCSTYTVDWDRGQCLIRVAMRENDLSICDIINKDAPTLNNKMSQNECYTAIAKKRHDISICDKLDPTFEILRCYSQVAIFTNDRSICELIPSDSEATKELKRQCEIW